MSLTVHTTQPSSSLTSGVHSSSSSFFLLEQQHEHGMRLGLRKVTGEQPRRRELPAAARGTALAAPPAATRAAPAWRHACRDRPQPELTAAG